MCNSIIIIVVEVLTTGALTLPISYGPSRSTSMAKEVKIAAVAGLKGVNYSTWRVQCRMALIRDGLWE